MYQFAFLADEFPALFAPAKKAELAALSDPRSACFHARLTLEIALLWMFRSDKTLRPPYQDTLAALVHEPSLAALTGPAIVAKAKIIKDRGNQAAHDTKSPSVSDAKVVVSELFHVCYWFARTYAKKGKPDPALSFDVAKLEKTLTITASTVSQINALAEKQAASLKAQREAEEARMTSEAGRAALEAEIAALRAEIAAVKVANQAQADTHDYDEATTRDAFIDLLLAEAGWPLNQLRDREFRVTGMPNAAGEGFVDYVLWGDDGKPLALVEAKRTKTNALVGQQQAKLYADCLEATFGRRPVIFCSNGYEHWIWDDAMYPPRGIAGFLKKDELVLLHQRRTTRKVLETVEVDETIVERFYQHRAIRRVGDAFESKQRHALLVMATGSGKTRTVIALIDQLLRANWVKRVLFLADRVALVKQAHGAFKAHLPSAPSANLLQSHDPTQNNHASARVCLSTYPTMMGLIDEMKDGEKRFGPGHFDLIVIDEAHRSVYRKYRAIFEYFDGLLVGLTATPRDEIDRDTYSLFQLERGVPTDSYDLEDAVDDGYLVPPKGISVPLRFQREGITYDRLSDEEKEAWDALEWSDEGDPPDHVDANDLNKWLFNIDTVDKVLKHLMTNGIKVAAGDRLGKTIIFAKNSAHARFIVERFDINYPHLKGSFASLIDYSVSYAQSLIDDFSEPEKAPHIAVSVDMLDTGIDVPDVVNLVFFKIVRSRTKFWQMVGRGTRLRRNLFGPGEDKHEFLIFDYCQNLEFFGENPDRAEPGGTAPIGERLFRARLELITELERAEHKGELGPRLRDRLHEEVTGMNVDNFIVRPHRQNVEAFQARAAWDELDANAQEALSTRIAGLPSAFRDDNLPAKQFDLLVHGAQLSLLRGEAAFARAQTRIRDVASSLEALGNIPLVAKQLSLILEIQTDEFWTDITVDLLDEVRRKLRLLVELIEPKTRKLVITDFEDEIGVGNVVTLPQLGAGVDKAQFRMKARRFVEKHRDHIALIKVRRADQLTQQDLDELERMFVEEDVVDAEALNDATGGAGLGVFLRSLTGLDRAAAKSLFSSFTTQNALSANQTEFVNLVIDSLTEAGIVDPALFYESPFTDLDDMGLAGVFEDKQAQELLAIVQRANATAAAA
ncbi:DEAD/DEAH box helicase family protein [Paracoccus beibuensis]|uniref:DEAD/DEAH box helicase family protein n=1 Tax=Paracoccus beibuensis TaxID=547602 RepID=UPI0022407F02|nr:DEAD/DEAH box helicase family protein [Paracoccus beibuensis]